MKSVSLTSALALCAVAAAGCATTRPAPTAATTTTVVTGAGAPDTEPSASIPGTVRQHVTGEVTYVDRRDGRVHLRTEDGRDLQLTLPPFALSSVREGDRASLDVTFTPR